MDNVDVINHGGCMISCPVEEYKKNMVRSALSMKADKVILLDNERSCSNLLKGFGLNTDAREISKDDISEIISSVIQVISEAKKEHDEVCVVLLPLNPVITIGVYVAACMEKVKIYTIISEFQAEHLPLPVFPFVNINGCEKLILTKIIENREIGKKRLLKIIEKEGNGDVLSSRPGSMEASVLRNMQRTLDKLEKMGLLSKRRSSRHFIWSSTSFGRLVIDHRAAHEKNLIKIEI